MNAPRIEATYLVGDFGAFGSFGGLCKEDKSYREDQEERDNESLDGRHDALARTMQLGDCRWCYKGTRGEAKEALELEF